MFDVEIPSTKQMIKMRQQTAAEEKLLLMAKEATVETRAIDIQNAIKQVLNNCIVTPNIDVEKFTFFDLSYLFIKLRAVSVNRIIKVSFVDKDDETSHTYDIDLDKVIVKYPETTLDKIKVDDNIQINLKYPDASLYINQDFLGAKTVTEAVEYLMINCIASIANQDSMEVLTPEEMKTFVGSLPLPVYKQISEYVDKMPTVFYEISYVNKNGKDRKIVLDTLNDFFMLA